MNKSKKQPAKKRSYKKRSNLAKKEKTIIANADSSELVPLLKPAKRDTEIQELAAICSIIENWNEDQKTRNLTFILSRYKDHI